MNASELRERAILGKQAAEILGTGYTEQEYLRTIEMIRARDGVAQALADLRRTARRADLPQPARRVALADYATALLAAEGVDEPSMQEYVEAVERAEAELGILP